MLINYIHLYSLIHLFLIFYLNNSTSDKKRYNAYEFDLLFLLLKLNAFLNAINKNFKSLSIAMKKKEINFHTIVIA